MPRQSRGAQTGTMMSPRRSRSLGRGRRRQGPGEGGARSAASEVAAALALTDSEGRVPPAPRRRGGF